MNKRGVTITLSIFLMVGLVGCDSKNTVKSTTDTKTATTAKAIPKIIPKPVPKVEVETVVKNPDFRKVKWGMTREEVKKTEKTPIMATTDDAIMYKDRVCGISDVQLAYQFNSEGKFTEGLFMFTGRHSNPNDYIDDYESIKKQLIAKYGEPSTYDNGGIWKDSLYKDSPQERGMAVITGGLIYGTKWNLPNTIITLFLQGDKFEPSMDVIYESKTVKKDATKSGL
ncbi:MULTISPECIES: hypothetical protein [Clostridium]|uniref:Uncharacterized protein n=1 Tax=Clostridium frigoriphilum TaxID=443253 RepID=A0ABU7UJC3_9CLOT|nr:hypothetical protein [Clostridium sp. DSM 17811]MBU3098418.1 hypothetical protein [Clostridium sp. DSM 17811]